MIIFLAGLAILVTATGSPAMAQTDPLPSWNDGARKSAIFDFVKRVTAEGGSDFVPVPQRIATFDNDGTLWCEQPIYIQGAFAFDRVKALASEHPDWKTRQPFAAILTDDMKAALADGSGTPSGAGRNGSRDFHGERRKNDTHASTTDGDARLFRKGPGKEARLCFMGHALMENRHGLIVDAVTTRASGHAERLAAIGLIEPRANGPNPITLGADKAYDTADFVMELREHTVTPHVAQNQSGRRSAIDRRTTRHVGYVISQRIRKRIEEAFGWAKTVAGLRKMRHRGLPKVGWQFTLAMAAYNLVRLPKLLAQPAA
jgi:hypothetical protein